MDAAQVRRGHSFRAQQKITVDHNNISELTDESLLCCVGCRGTLIFLLKYKYKTDVTPIYLLDKQSYLSAPKNSESCSSMMSALDQSHTESILMIWKHEER